MRAIISAVVAFYRKDCGERDLLAIAKFVVLVCTNRDRVLITALF